MYGVYFPQILFDPVVYLPLPYSLLYYKLDCSPLRKCAERCVEIPVRLQVLCVHQVCLECSPASAQTTHRANCTC